MNKPPTGILNELPISDQLRIDEICETFESAWRLGQRPSIENYVLPGARQTNQALLQELIAVDLHHRSKIGESIDIQDYLQRFPQLDPSWLAMIVAETANDLNQQRTPRTPTDREAPNSRPNEVPAWLGEYELLSEIARGGMGVVYQARDPRLNRLVAVKLILSGEFASERERRRFQVEAEAAAQLDHPHIVPIYEVGEHAGRRYLVMKLIEGRSLAQSLAKREWVAVNVDQQNTIARLMATIARTVHHAHQHGILHRDLKPSNILLDEKGAPYLTDFGLAKQLDEKRDITGTGAVLGTPCYMAPEAASGFGHITTAIDVYALGVILYELLTGRPPFFEGGPIKVSQQVVNDEPESPRRKEPRIARDLEIICLKCLAKQPSARFSSAEILADDLEHFVRGEPILARPSTGWERTWRWCRRNPVLRSLTLDETSSQGVTIGSLLLSSATDVDSMSLGMAVTGLTGNGIWQYSTNDGSTWSDVGTTVSSMSALLLSSATKIRFVPSAGFRGLGTISYRAWDGSTGVVGDRIAIGASLAFSLATETASVTVGNTQPSLS